MSKSSVLFVRGVDPGLMVALVADAESREASMNDLAVTILAEKFNVRFTPTGRAGRPASGSSPNLPLRVPDQLHQKIRHAAVRQRVTQSALVQEALCDHYGLSGPSESAEVAAS